MTAREGGTKKDPSKLSAHTLDNTGPRVFNVFDFDSPPSEWQPGLIMYLAQFCPPVMVLHSGGKSLHAWFPVFEKESDNAKFWALGLALGADVTLLKNRSQFARMPNGTRKENGKKQEVAFLDLTKFRS